MIEKKTIKYKHLSLDIFPVHLFHGRKRIDKDISNENLLMFRTFMSDSSITWGLIYGTLLGAIRGNDFIDHDEDTDIFVLHEQKTQFIEWYLAYMQDEFKIIRFERNLISLIRDEEYIDVYFFKKSIHGRRCDDFFIPRKFFKSQTQVSLQGNQYPTIAEPLNFLSYQYGEDWRIPKKNAHAKGKPNFLKLFKRKVWKIFK